MSKQTRREKREKEARILAEIDEAMQSKQTNQEVESTPDTSTSSVYDATMPSEVHCKKCKTLMEKGVCPACGFKIYVPMNAEKRNKIKLITTIIGFVVFFVIFIILQYKK